MCVRACMRACVCAYLRVYVRAFVFVCVGVSVYVCDRMLNSSNFLNMLTRPPLQCTSTDDDKKNCTLVTATLLILDSGQDDL